MTITRTRPRRPVATQPSPAPWVRRVLGLGLRTVGGVLVLLVFVLLVFPTGRYVDQRDQLDEAVEQLERLQAENADLQARIARLESDDEIERVARDEYDMVLPGEEVYAVLPPAGG